MKKLVVVVTCVAVLLPLVAMAQPAQPPETSDRKEAARSHFELGLSYFDNGEWGPALAEFLRSRELYPTRAATKDAATCLEKEKRYDEALDMFETLTREFPDLSLSDRSLVEREMSTLGASVGVIDVRGAEPGARIIIDGRERGDAPLRSPVRVSVGSHVVRAFKEGFLPFERRVDVAGRQTATITVAMSALTRSGRLRVAEETGRSLDLLVDNAVVGTTPWEGRLAVGEHTIALRGKGTLGTPPASALVRLDQSTSLSLRAEPLEAVVRIEPIPSGASVAVDGVIVGQGVWDGRLRVGGHRLEVGAAGFLPSVRKVSLPRGQAPPIVVTLERDPASALWRERHPAHFTLEIAGAFGPAPAYGGDAATCSACRARIAAGGFGSFRGGYELGSGLGFTIDAGYLRVVESVTRAATLKPVGRPPNPGTMVDDLRLGGATLGASAGYHRGASLTFTLRLGAGVFVGTGRDYRVGGFTNDYGQPYRVAVGEAPPATYGYLAPEVRLGHRFGRSFEIDAGLTAIVLVSFRQPAWRDASLVPTGLPPSRGDGPAAFGTESLAGSTVFVLAPGIGARYEF